MSSQVGVVTKLNCWESKRCGREPGGKNVARLGVCPASTETRLDGVHGGVNAGRACWVVVGTLCQGTVQGTFAKKLAACEECGFFKRVIAEEYPDNLSTAELIDKLKD
jgi:hypothetical protein